MWTRKSRWKPFRCRKTCPPKRWQERRQSANWTCSKETTTSFRPHPPQIPPLRSQSRFIGAVAGKRGGKSVLGAVWLLQEIQRLRDAGIHGHFLITAPTVKLLEQATLPTFREYFSSMGWGAGKGNGWREAKSCFELNWKTTGGEPCFIYVRTAEEPDHLSGMTVLAAWIDEAGQMKDGVWDEIQSRLSFNQGRAILTTTPYAPNWFWRDVMTKAITTHTWTPDHVYTAAANTSDDADKAIEIFRWTTKDNPHFPAEEYERLRKTMSPDKFARDYCGEARAMEGLVYDLAEDAIIKPFDLDPTWRRFAGMDFGQADPTVVLCIAEKPEIQADPVKGIRHMPSIYYVYREFYKRGALMAQPAAFLESEGQLDCILYDPSAAQEAAELSRGLGIRRMIPADNAKVTGIERIKGLLFQGRLRIFRGRCENTIREMLSYHHKAPNFDRPQSDEPVGVNDHCMDALKYAFSRENVHGIYRGLKKQVATRVRRGMGWQERASRGPVDRFTGYAF